MADTTDEIKQINTTYTDMLRKSAQETGSIVCMGLDPSMKAMPHELHREFNTGLLQFYEKIFDRMEKENVLPGAFKPNLGFYEKYNNGRNRHFSGSETLSDVIFMIRERFPGIPIILDYKKGDIATSSANYAEVGKNWGVDAVTVAPYMGTDSVRPFVETGLGVYVLDRTSNKGGKDLQNLRAILNDTILYERLEGLLIESLNGRDRLELHTASTPEDVQRFVKSRIKPLIEEQAPQLYEVVAGKIIDWSEGYSGVGAVVGATNPMELEKLARFFSKNRTPLLIPGVGSQGGSAKEVMQALVGAGYDLDMVRINSSSGITHSWEKSGIVPKDWDVVVVNNLRETNKEVGYHNYPKLRM